MDMLDKTQLQWLLAGIGAVVVVLIYLWGMRARIKEGLRKRRRRPTEGNEPMLGSATGQMSEDLLADAHDFGELGRITPDHHLADKVLVDVEIRPILRKESPPVTEATPSSPKRLHHHRGDFPALAGYCGVTTRAASGTGDSGAAEDDHRLDRDRAARPIFQRP